MKNMDERTKRKVFIAGLAVIAILSFTIGVRFFTSHTFNRGTVAYLDGKRSTVLELTAAATAASAAITMIPGDIGTPIAGKLADLSSYTMIVLCAIFLEKYLVTVTGYIAFRVMIPVSCLLAGIALYIPQREKLLTIACKITLFSLILFSVIPTSVGISRLIEATSDDSITETIEAAKESAEEIENNSQSQSIWDRFISTIEGGINTVTKKFEGILNNFIEAIAILIVTACIIPILVLILMYWIIRMFFSVDPQKPSFLRLMGTHKPEA